MKELVDRYAARMIRTGLAENPLVCGLDDELYWNRTADETSVLQAVFDNMNINSLICAEPAEPYRSILRFLAARNPEVITPQDCETRTFLHDLPVTPDFSPESILQRLRQRKSVIIPTGRTVKVVTFGTVSPEQAYVTFSSVCFSTFVLFFADLLADLRKGSASEEQKKLYRSVLPFVDSPSPAPPALLAGPFTDESRIVQAMIEAGKYTVDYGLVDSYFGNISYRFDETVYISQTGSSLDELAGCIDPCRLDGSSSAGITASSELTAHNEIYLRTDARAILHGHPKFTVILSMDCEISDCPNRGRCHIRCDQQRFIEDIPIVPGEVGTGPTGLCNTLPPAIKGKRGAIVWGHGLFTTGRVDFNEAFRSLFDIENRCRKTYIEQIQDLIVRSGRA